MNHWARPLPTRPITADEVLERLNALRHCDYYPAEFGEADFTASMAIDDWIELVGWDEMFLLDEMNSAVSAQLTNDEWTRLAFTEPTTLGDVCQWVSENASWQYVRPLRIAGTESIEAGVFLAILHLMERSGVDSSGIKPSDSLAPWLLAHSEKFVPELKKFFLLDLPEANYIRHPLTSAGHAMCLWEFVFLMIAACAAWIAQAFGLLATSIFGIAFAIASIQLGERLLPSHFHFSDVNTFGDLARWIAGSQHADNDRSIVTV